MSLALAVAVVLVIIFVVPIAVYGIFAAASVLREPTVTGKFLLSVLVQKVGTAVAFVGLLYLALDTFDERWLEYAGLWVLMFVIVEAGQAIGPDYSWAEAVAGAISEIIYFPASAWATAWLLA